MLLSPAVTWPHHHHFQQWPLFHFTNPILHPPSYISPPCDHVTQSVRFHQGGGGSGSAVSSVVVLCKVSLCVLKLKLNVTGGGWTRVRQRVEADERKTEATWASTTVQQPSNNKPPFNSAQCNFISTPITPSLSDLLLHVSPSLFLFTFSQSAFRLLHVNLYMCKRFYTGIHWLIFLFRFLPSGQTVELSMKYWQLDWSRSNNEIQ